MDIKKQFNRLIFSFFCIGYSAIAEDTIIFKNGDTLTGNIIEQNKVQVSFNSSALGTIILPTSTIAEIKPHTESLYKAPIISTDIPLPFPEPPDSETTEQPPQPKIKTWEGQAGVTIYLQAIKHGTGIEQNHEVYETAGHLKKNNQKSSIQWEWSYIHKEDQFQTYQNELLLLQTYNRTLTGGYYAEAKTAYRQRINIKNEFLQTAEIGKKWFDQPKFLLSTSLGAGFNRYEIDGDNSSNPNVILDQKLRWQISNSFAIIQEFFHTRTFASSGETQKYDTTFISGLENKLVYNLFLRFEYRNAQNMVTKSPDANHSEEKFLSSLIYKF